MAQVQVISLSAGDTISQSIRIDLSRFRNGVGLIATVDAGATANYTVQVSADGVHWNNHDVLVSETTSKNDSLQFPAVLLRMIGTVANGSVTLGIVQAS